MKDKSKYRDEILMELAYCLEKFQLQVELGVFNFIVTRTKSDRICSRRSKDHHSHSVFVSISKWWIFILKTFYKTWKMLCVSFWKVEKMFQLSNKFQIILKLLWIIILFKLLLLNYFYSTVFNFVFQIYFKKILYEKFLFKIVNNYV